MIVKVLLTNEDAIVCLTTTASETTLFSFTIHQKYPLIKNFWGVMDGLNFSLVHWAGNETQQNNFYNGWTHEHYVTNLFFSPDGKIRCSYFNGPGVLHNSTMAIWSSIYDLMEMVYRDTGKKVVVNSAFASKKSNAMLKYHQNNVDVNGNNLA